MRSRFAVAAKSRSPGRQGDRGMTNVGGMETRWGMESRGMTSLKGDTNQVALSAILKGGGCDEGCVDV